jgi:MHS family proline/betaine transporter-like MFS transporter
MHSSKVISVYAFVEGYICFCKSSRLGDEMYLAQTRRVLAAGMIGNVLECYDFAIYGYFAAAIGRQFFPHEDAVAQLLSAFGVFSLGYLMRPVGGALVGHIGDQFTRRAALTFSVAAMAVPTFLIGLLPGYATLGLLAPVALSLLRMVQGLSVGGEYTRSMVFVVERASEGRRGLMGALNACRATGGILLGWAPRLRRACRPRHFNPGVGAFPSCSGSLSASRATFCGGM